MKNDEETFKYEDESSWTSSGGIPRRVSEEWLVTREPGWYVIRDSLTRDGLILSVRLRNGVKHFKINQRGHSKVYLNGGRNFDSLKMLIKHYRNNCIAPGICLKSPLFQIDGTLTEESYQKRRSKVTGPDPGSDDWQVDISNLKLGQKIGRGRFGTVYSAKWNGSLNVAVKRIRSNKNDTNTNLMKEINNLKQLRHPYIVSFYGISHNNSSTLIITELHKKGNLSAYLRKKGRKIPLDTLTQYCAQVATGMQYLCENGFVHRDLSARNILVADDNTIKIADFGLMKLINQVKPELVSEDIAFRWTAPESLVSGKFSPASDVWSYGMLLYEIFTYCTEIPFQGLSYMDVMKHINNRYTLKRPHRCPKDVYNIMMRCWDYAPEDRPSFKDLKEELLQKINDGHQQNISKYSPNDRRHSTRINHVEITSELEVPYNSNQKQSSAFQRLKNSFKKKNKKALKRSNPGAQLQNSENIAKYADNSKISYSHSMDDDSSLNEISNSNRRSPTQFYNNETIQSVIYNSRPKDLSQCRDSNFKNASFYLKRKKRSENNKDNSEHHSTNKTKYHEGYYVKNNNIPRSNHFLKQANKYNYSGKTSPILNPSNNHSRKNREQMNASEKIRKSSPYSDHTRLKDKKYDPSERRVESAKSLQNPTMYSHTNYYHQPMQLYGKNHDLYNGPIFQSTMKSHHDTSFNTTVSETLV